MNELELVLFNQPNWEQNAHDVNEQLDRLSPEFKIRISEILMRFYGRYGFEETFTRIRGLTVKGIIDASLLANIVPDESGKVDHVQYELYYDHEK